MESKITYKNKTYELCEDFIDIGYMGENFEAKNLDGQSIEVQRSNPQRGMSLFVSASFVDEDLIALDELLSHIEVELECYFIFSSIDDTVREFAKKLKKFKVCEDSFEDFGGLYGVRIEEGELEGKLAKALFLISKDGAVFFIEFLKDLEDSFDIERLRIELNRAYVTYTGVGCHG